MQACLLSLGPGFKNFVYKKAAPTSPPPLPNEMFGMFEYGLSFRICLPSFVLGRSSILNSQTCHSHTLCKDYRPGPLLFHGDGACWPARVVVGPTGNSSSASATASPGSRNRPAAAWQEACAATGAFYIHGVNEYTFPDTPHA